MAWDGMVLAGYPRMEVLDPRAATPEVLHAAMDLEKGAWNFYQAVGRRFPAAPWIAAFADLAAAETAHARIIYRFWAQTQQEAPPFEALFDRLEGRILEGGLDLAEAVDRLAALAPDRPLEIIEMALHIEAAAYDLYRTVAEGESLAPQAREALLAIAQAEKGHIRILVEAMGRL